MRYHCAFVRNPDTHQLIDSPIAPTDTHLQIHPHPAFGGAESGHRVNWVCRWSRRVRRIAIAKSRCLCSPPNVGVCVRKIGFDYAPITTDVMLRAAELWAAARRAGLPTAPPDALDGDVILAAEVILSTGVGDLVTVATDNVGHLARFVDAQPWEQIAP
jgi:hypothetical protein